VLEKLLVAHLVQIFLEFYATKSLITVCIEVHIRPYHEPVESSENHNSFFLWLISKIMYVIQVY
jgi:hypothetical protein